MGGNRIILDSSAVSSLAKENGRLRVVLRKAIASGTEILVPAPAIFETIAANVERGARIDQVLRACKIIALDESLARTAGALRNRRPSSGAVNAMVVACADAVPNSFVITRDLVEMRALAAQRGRTIVVGY